MIVFEEFSPFNLQYDGCCSLTLRSICIHDAYLNSFQNIFLAIFLKINILIVIHILYPRTTHIFWNLELKSDRYHFQPLLLR